MARAILSAADDASRILDAGALARVGGQLHVFLVAGDRESNECNHGRQEQADADQDLLHESTCVGAAGFTMFAPTHIDSAMMVIVGLNAATLLQGTRQQWQQLR
jgi:hypothetical protein